jgi:hypothetical protein
LVEIVSTRRPSAETVSTEQPAAEKVGSQPPTANSPRTTARAPTGELLSVVSALALLVLMFAVRWYGVVRRPGRPGGQGHQTAVGVWGELPVLRWLMLLTALFVLGSVAIRISQRSHGSQTNASPLVTLLGTLTAVLLIYRVLVDLPSRHSVVDVKVGGFLGLVAAFGIALGGFESVREQRLRRAGAPQPSHRRADVAMGPHTQ